MKLRSGRIVPKLAAAGLLNTLCCFGALLSHDPLLDIAKGCIGQPAAHMAMAHFDALTQTYDEVDFVSYVAASKQMKKGTDPDFPTYHQAMMHPDADEWKDAIHDELKLLTEIKTWTLV